jgi:hypothetical protein
MIRSKASFMLLIAAALGTLALSSQATARSHAYNGPAGSGRNAGVEFGAHFRKGRPVSVYRFEFHNIPARCGASGTSAVTDQLPITMSVGRHRKFKGHATINGGKLTIDVSGTFARDHSKATGRLRAHGTAPACSSADTGPVTWSAPEVGA